MHAQCNYINIIIMIITVYIYHKHNILCVHMDFKMRQIIIIIIIEINYYNTMIYIVYTDHTPSLGMFCTGQVRYTV